MYKKNKQTNTCIFSYPLTRIIFRSPDTGVSIIARRIVTI